MGIYYGVVYIITCLINGKQYVGQTIQDNPINRWKTGHLSSARGKSRVLLHNAIRKYGAESFIFEIVGYAEDQEALNVLEDLLICLNKTLAPTGYNLRRGGSRGKFTPTAVQNLIIANNKPEAILKRSVSATKAHARPDVKLRMKLAGKEAQNRPEVVERKSIAIREALSTPKARERNSLNRLKDWAKPERREKQRLVMSDPVVNKNWHAAMAAAQNRPEVLLRNRECMTGRRWINNGTVNRFIAKDVEILEGWTFGKLPSKKPVCC